MKETNLIQSMTNIKKIRLSILRILLNQISLIIIDQRNA